MPGEKVEFAAAVYRCFEQWMHVSETGLGGRLLLASLTSADGTNLVRAASIAGAATMAVCEGAGEARALLRQGVCDFLVTNLDEALRIVKNELRREKTVAVCIRAEAAAILEECKDRGVQPDFILEAEPTLLARGARLVGCGAEWREQPGPPRLVSWATAAGASRAMESLDALAIDAMGPLNFAQRQLWLRRSPQYLGRAQANCRVLPMQAEETLRFAAAVRSRMAADAALAGVRAWYGNEALL